MLVLAKSRWRWSESVCHFSRVWLFVTPWTVAHQAPLSMGFSRQGYWSGLPFPSPGDLPDPGIETRSPALQADSLRSEPPGKPESHRDKGDDGTHWFLCQGESCVLWHREAGSPVRERPFRAPTQLFWPISPEQGDQSSNSLMETWERRAGSSRNSSFSAGLDLEPQESRT